MCSDYTGYGVLAVLGPITVSILSILVSNRVWFLHYGLEVGMLFRRNYIFTRDSSLSITPSKKALYNAFNIGLNEETSSKTGLNQDIDLSIRSLQEP